MNKWHRRRTAAAPDLQVAAQPTDPPAPTDPPVAVPPEPPASDPQLEGQPLFVAQRRGGYQPVVDAAGAEVARIRGDYVVGFTTEIQGRLRWFEDLDGAIAAVADEVRATREAAAAHAKAARGVSA